MVWRCNSPKLMNRIYDWKWPTPNAEAKRRCSSLQSLFRVSSTYIAFTVYRARIILTPQTEMKLQLMVLANVYASRSRL